MPFFRRQPSPELHPDTSRRLRERFGAHPNCSPHKRSGGNIVDLLNAVHLAQTDLRDLLMAAGFGFDAKAHLSWEP